MANMFIELLYFIKLMFVLVSVSKTYSVLYVIKMTQHRLDDEKHNNNNNNPINKCKKKRDKLSSWTLCLNAFCIIKFDGF